MLSGIEHRGPDGVGQYLGEHVGLLHARLSIIDTSELANQPLYNEDKTLVLVCNGEIYNHLTLRQELEEKGHHFYCHSDSEVLLHLYEEHRHEPVIMLNKLKGMFAFALYDMKNDVLFLARDRFGIKPLYYTIDEEGFYFASEINALVNVRPELRNVIDYTSLYEYYQFLSIPEPNTIYENVKALPAGHFALIQKNEVTITPWYSLEEMAVPNKYTDVTVFSQQLFRKLETVIHEHLISDVPIGSFLSAGIDSTIVTHFASKHADRSFTSISAGFPNYPEDESKVAEETAGKMRVKHHTYTLVGGFFDDASTVMRYFDQPFAVSSAFSLFRISKLARNEMKVVLTGDGGDEVFAGYDHKHKPFYIPRIVHYTPLLLRPIIGKLLSSVPVEKLKELAGQFTISLTDRFLNRSRVLSEQEALQFIPEANRPLIERKRLSQHLDDLLVQVKSFSQLHQLLYLDFNTFLKSEMLYKVDRMTMANQLEGRVPFLDHEIVELAFSATSDLLREQYLGKLPLRKWVEEHYPGLGLRPKTGFNTPLAQLLQEDEASRKIVTDLISNLTDSSLADKECIKSVIHEVRSKEVNVSHVMLLVCLAGWFKLRIDS
ncbi:MAG: asparagine synthase (glutamine-hydrolyzing) [Cyclobacteriaceae bacterium]|nr:asparagine synthase (glutamine-hydrolyzing) [Flammeovirgaceae bacterium]